MANTYHKQLSSLHDFTLSFEYDKTWQEARKAVKARSHSE